METTDTDLVIRRFYQAPPRIDTIVFEKGKRIVASARKMKRKIEYWDEITGQVIPMYRYEVLLRLFK